MLNLTKEYTKTAQGLYTAMTNYKKNQKNNPKYYLLILEYQHTCAILRQLKNYCKARGLI